MNHLKIKATAIVGFIVFILLLPSAVLAKVFCVSTSAELQAALDDAQSNGEDDLIKVEQGNYLGDFTYRAARNESFDITIEGGYTPGCTSRVLDPSKTIVDKDINIETQSGNVKVEGFTFAGSGFFKIDISVNEGSIDINKNIISGNRFTNLVGFRLRVGEGDVIVTNNIISNINIGNSIAIVEGSVIVAGNELRDNRSRFDGGALNIFTSKGGDILVNDNVFFRNEAVQDGGAIFIETEDEGLITIINNVFNENMSGGDGGAVKTVSGGGSPALISGNSLTGNEAKGNGGAFDSESKHGQIRVVGNDVDLNRAAGDGGGGRTSTEKGTSLYDGNNISGNTADGNGGGVDAFIADEGVLEFLNNLIEDNNAGGNGGGLNSDDADKESKKPHKKDKATKEVGSLGNQFKNNSAVGHGGGAHYEFAFVDDEREPVINISGDQYTGNIANLTGGGLDVSLGAGTLYITNSAFTFNLAGDTGGGAFIETAGLHTRILHSTATGNNAVIGAGIAVSLLDDQTVIDVINTVATDSVKSGLDLAIDDDADGNNTGAAITLDTNILGRWRSFCAFTPRCVPNISEVNTLNVDPKLDTDGFHLLFSSPATDTANPSFALSVDIDGDIRPFDGNGDGMAVSDIGADEFVGVSANTPPVADANGPYTASVNETFLLDGTGSFDPDPGDTIDLYEWDLDGDGTFDITGDTPALSPAIREDFGIGTVGSYTVTLRVTDNRGATGTDTALLEVTPPPGTIAVTNTNDSGTSSLREAISIANASSLDTVIFSIPGAPPFTIQPLSPLPEITLPAILDATTQPGFAGTPVVVLDGSSAGPGADGLSISAGNSTVLGFNIHNFDGNGIALSNAVGGYVVEGNFIGTDVSGLLDRGNGQNGINIFATSGSQVNGNLISGNDANGIRILNVTDLLNPTVVQGNRIGVDVTGMAPLGNTGEGLRVENSSNIRIGGTASGAGNIIGANSDGASVIGSTDITLQGNQWGDNINIGNLGAALGFAGGSSNSVVEGNTFAFNGYGVVVFPGSTGIEITNNRSHDQQLGLGIDLDFDGVTANDDQDADTGANGLQNYPVISQADSFSVVGILNSTPDTAFTLEFFSSTSCNPSGFGEGESFIGAINVVTDSNGNTTFATSLPMSVPVGHFMTATATNDEGTSEFSQCRLVE